MLTPRFAMFYSDDLVIKDDGEDIEVTFRVPRAWFGAPKDGLQTVMRFRPDGKIVVLNGHNQYAVLMNGEPMATDDLSPLLRAAGIAKSGLWIPDEEYEEVRERVRQYRKEWEQRK